MKLEQTTWLIEQLLMGEHAAWQEIGKCSFEGVEWQLLRKMAQGEDASRLALPGYAEELRLLVQQQGHATTAIALAATAILRLSDLGHEDPAWAALMPRWLGAANLPPLVRGIGLIALAVNGRERLAADDYAELVEEALHLLPREAPLRAAHLHQFALYLGLRGMLRRISDLVDLPHVGDPEPEVEPALLAECFYDAVCCGRTAQAAFLSRRMESTPEVAWQLGLIRLHRVYIPVFTAVAHGDALPVGDEAPSTPVIRALLADDAHLLDAFDPSANTDEVSPLLSCDALRVALARRDAPRARALLTARANGSGRHWLDDFFRARMLLLEDQQAEAGAAFARVEAAALRYGALERLEIELRLATELSRHDCCRLGLAAAGLPNLVGGVGEISPPAVAEALLVGDSQVAGGLRQALTRLRPGPEVRMLLCGPADGSRRLLAGLIHERLGGGTQQRLSATSHTSMAELADGLLAAAEGTLVIEDAERLEPDLQGWLVDRLESGLPCRVIFAVNGDLSAQVARGHWRADLYWPLAAGRIVIPDLGERRGDLAVMTPALLRALGCHARCEVEAVQVVGAMPLAGGWAELRALCMLLAGMRPVGLIDRAAVVAARAELDGVVAERG